jgi:hypothetical protein
VHPVLADFYDEVLREMLAALGGALFVGSFLALVRRTRDEGRVQGARVARARPGSPVRGQARPGPTRELAQAPLARTVTYAAIGFVVMVVGIASIVGR